MGLCHDRRRVHGNKVNEPSGLLHTGAERGPQGNRKSLSAGHRTTGKRMKIGKSFHSVHTVMQRHGAFGS